MSWLNDGNKESAKGWEAQLALFGKLDGFEYHPTSPSLNIQNSKFERSTDLGRSSKS